MSLPWFPFFVDDFLASPKVRRMDAEHVGVYIFLLCEQWQCERIAGAYADLAIVCKSTPEIVENVLRSCFEKEGDGWVNRRLQGVVATQNARSAKASAAAKARWDKASDANAYADAERTQGGRNAIQNQNQKKKSPSGQKKRWRFVPKDWDGPKDHHRTKASELGVSLPTELEAFRAHEFDKPKSDPDRAFTTWLLNAARFQKRNGNGKGYRDRAEGTDWEAEAHRLNREGA